MGTAQVGGTGGGSDPVLGELFVTSSLSPTSLCPFTQTTLYFFPLLGLQKPGKDEGHLGEASLHPAHSHAVLSLASGVATFPSQAHNLGM